MSDTLNLDQLRQFCNALPSKALWIAYSGGVDSHVLLHALKALKIPVSAIHVHHGLSDDADAWAAHCQQVCDDLSIPLVQRQVDLSEREGKSVEALAREARYAVMADALGEGGVLLTAHHQDDQAETLLLQLLRGSGPKGLSAMPASKTYQHITVARPFLSVTRAAILAYAKVQALTWVEDASNQSTDFHRNYLRHEVMPALKEKWPAVSHALARSASHCAEANTLIDDLAAQDYQAVVNADDKTMSISRLLRLTALRQKQVIRYWLTQLALPLPSAVKLATVFTDVIDARPDATPLVTWEGVELRRYRDALFVNPVRQTFDNTQVLQWDYRQPLALPADLGCLTAKRGQGRGIKLTELDSLLEVRFRQGGEACYLPGRLGQHSLKHLFQEWGVPAWERDRIPLIYYQQELIAVVGYCVCQGFVANNGEDSLEIIRGET